jgi:hypothetical protein
MSRSGLDESSLSDFSDGEACEQQMDKENQRDSDHESDAFPARLNDDHQRRIYEQQQLQRQQFYSQQQRDRRQTRRHSQPNTVHAGHTSSPDDAERAQSSPETSFVARSQPVEGTNASASSSDSDSSSSGASDAMADTVGSPFDGNNEWNATNEMNEQSDSGSLTDQRAQPQPPPSLPTTFSTVDNSYANYSVQNDAASLVSRPFLGVETMDESIDASQDVPMKSPEPVPEYLVDRIDQEKWPGVNGDYDNDGEWREWQEMTTAVNVYSGDIVNILPYVNISC